MYNAFHGLCGVQLMGMQRLRVLADMLQKPAYSGLCIAVAGAAGLVFIMFFDWKLSFVFFDPSFALPEKVTLLSVYFFTSPESFLFMIFILLFRLNIMSFIYRERRGEKRERSRWGSFPVAWLGSSVVIACGGSILAFLLVTSQIAVTETGHAFLKNGAWIIAIALSGIGLWRVLSSHPQHVSDEHS
jgi:hypothetical protein